MQLVQDLLAEHDHIRSVLAIFRARLRDFADGKSVDYDILEGSIAYCREYLDQWHHPREDELYRTMVRRDPDKAGALEGIVAQHEGLNRSTTELSRIFRDVADRGAIYLREDLVRSGESLVADYLEHLSWEETHFFPMTREILTEEDRAALARLPAGPSDPLKAAQIERRYRALASSMAGS